MLDDLLGLGILELRERRALVEAGRLQVRVRRDARDEDVVADRVPQQLGGRADDARHVAGRVDDGVPLAALERREVAVAVAAQLLGLREELRVRLRRG